MATQNTKTRKPAHSLTVAERYAAWKLKQETQTPEEKEAERQNSFYRLQPMGNGRYGKSNY